METPIESHGAVPIDDRSAYGFTVEVAVAGDGGVAGEGAAA
jgi:hypothetical protein